MKVLHVIPSIAPHHGGPTEAVIRMVAALREAGVDAEIATTNDNGKTDLDVPTGQRTEYRGVPVWFFPRLNSRIRFVREFKISRAFARWFETALHDYDLIHVHAVFSWVCSKAMKGCRKNGKAYVVRTLGQLTVWSLKQSALRKKLYWRLGERANVRGASWVHCTSDREKSELTLMDRETEARVIPHGVVPGKPIANARNSLLRRFDWPQDARVWLFLSRWHPVKNLDNLVKSLAQLRESDPNIRVILAGTGETPYTQQIESLVKAEGMSDIVELPGQVQGEEKELLLQGADLFALPSKNENFGIALLEALSRGLPVLTTKNVDLHPIVEAEDAGIVCRADSADITSGAQKCSEHWNELTRTALAQARAEKFCSRFGWPAVAANIESAYEDTLGA